MENTVVQECLDQCDRELDRIEQIIMGLGQLSNVVPFLTKYSVIKASGALELSFKTLISDHLNDGSRPQIIIYINKTIREKSMNPNLSNIYQLLKKLDPEWSRKFKSEIGQIPNSDRIVQSLQSLNVARNAFAHGLEPNVSFPSVRGYFRDARELVLTLENVIIGANGV